jgi:small-conductance mechanosensitive channel
VSPSATLPAEPLTLAGTWERLKETLLNIWSDLIAHIPAMVAGVGVLLVTWAIAKFGTGVLETYLDRKNLRRSSRDLILRFALIGVWIFGLMVAAMLLFPGLTPTKALGALGLGSVAVGFAFKDIFENFLAGVMVLWRFPFEIGDTITCDGITGEVDRITVRNTLISLPTGELVILPNSTLFKSPVQVLTEWPERRVETTVGVAYGENVSDAIEVIEEALTRCETVSTGHKSAVWVKAFGASSIDIDIAWWADSTLRGERASRSEVIASVKGALDHADIEIPFPHRTLTFKEPLPTADLSSNSTGGA